MKQSVHEYVATVSLKDGGEPVEIHFDVIQCLSHGFNFCRADGSFRFLSARLVDELDVVKAAPVAGSA